MRPKVGCVLLWLCDSDVVARFGGGEFVIVLPNRDLPAAESLLPRLSEASPCPWTAGTVLWEQQDSDVLAAVRRADVLMYRRSQ